MDLNSVKDVSFEKIREFLNKQFWIFAKTYAQRCPHEYIIRGRCEGTDEEFMEVIKYIQKNGEPLHFFKSVNKYIYVDGYRYWTMGGFEDDPTMALNRHNSKDYIVSIRWKGLENNGNNL